MADRWAVASGSWSSTSTWNGGTLPGVNDDVYADGFNVTINQNVTVLSLRTTARSGGTAGGQFTALEDGLFVVTADTYAGTTTCLRLEAGFNRQIGNSYGGSSSTAYGTHCLEGAIQQGNSYGGETGKGTLCEYGGVQQGDAYGATTDYGHGTVTRFGGILVGNSYGGSGVYYARGCYCESGGWHIGNSYAGSGAGSDGTYLWSGGCQIGDSFGGATGGVYGTHVNYGCVLVGTATGGSVANAYGAYVTEDGWQIGSSVVGTADTAHGTVLLDRAFYAVGAITNGGGPGEPEGPPVMSPPGQMLFGSPVSSDTAGCFATNAYFLFFNGLTLSDIAGTGNTAVAFDHFLALASRPFWSRIFTGGGAVSARKFGVVVD